MQIQSLNHSTDFKAPGSPKVEPTESAKVEARQDLPSESANNSQTARLRDLQKTLSQHNISLSFRLDEKTNQVIVKLVDDQTGEAIRQTPSDVSLKLAEINANIQGQFVDGNF